MNAFTLVGIGLLVAIVATIMIFSREGSSYKKHQESQAVITAKQWVSEQPQYIALKKCCTRGNLWHSGCWTKLFLRGDMPRTATVNWNPADDVKAAWRNNRGQWTFLERGQRASSRVFGFCATGVSIGTGMPLKWNHPDLPADKAQ